MEFTYQILYEYQETVHSRTATIHNFGENNNQYSLQNHPFPKAAQKDQKVSVPVNLPIADLSVQVANKANKWADVK